MKPEMFPGKSPFLGVGSSHSHIALAAAAAAAAACSCRSWLGRHLVSGEFRWSVASHASRCKVMRSYKTKQNASSEYIPTQRRQTMQASSSSPGFINSKGSALVDKISVLQGVTYGMAQWHRGLVRVTASTKMYSSPLPTPKS
jgi:hypothetical protein